MLEVNAWNGRYGLRNSDTRLFKKARPRLFFTSNEFSIVARFKRFLVKPPTSVLRLLVVGLLLTQMTVSLGAASARVKRINISRDNEKMLMLVDSNWPIQFQFETPKKGKAVSWSFKGADYYAALTRFFTNFDVDSLLDCMDNLKIIPRGKNAARFEADLGPNLRASVYESSAPNGDYRVVMMLRPTTKSSACFSHPIPSALVAPAALFSAPKPKVVPPAPVAVAKAPQELTAEDIVKSQRQQKQAQRPAPALSARESAFQRGMADSHYSYLLAGSFDRLIYSNKGGVSGDNWLQKYGDSEFREISARIANEEARFPFFVSLRSYTQYIENNVRVDKRKLVLDRAWIGYRFSPGFSVRAGIMYEPSTSETASALDALPFLEKGLSDYISPQFNPGVLLSYQGDHLGVDVGGFGQRSVAPDTQTSRSARLSYRFNASSQSITRFDVAFSQATPVDNTLQVAASPETHLILPTMYDSGALTNVDSLSRASLGVALIYHGFNYAANMTNVSLDSSNAGISKFTAKNLWFTWLSGPKSRTLKNGRWLTLRSDKLFSEIDWRSWEIGFRYSAIQDNTEEQLITKTIALNWYFNKIITIKSNYIFATQVADPTRPLDNDADLFLVRLQLTL